MLAWVVHGKAGRSSRSSIYTTLTIRTSTDGFDRHFGVRPRSAADMAILEQWFIHDKVRLTREKSVCARHLR